MRRRLRNQLVLVIAALALLSLGALLYQQDRASKATEALPEDYEVARRSITYIASLESGWIEFPLSGFHSAIRLTTNANLKARELTAAIFPVQARYVIEYVLIRADRSETEVKSYHEIATLADSDSRMFYLDQGLLPAPGQPIQLSLADDIRGIRIRLREADPAIADIGVRINALEDVAERETQFRWQRLTREQQARLFTGSIYPPEFARPQERVALARTRFVPLGPEGVAERDYFPRVLYVHEENELEEESPDQVSEVAGLRLGPDFSGVIRVPQEGGDISLSFQATERLDTEFQVLAVHFIPTRPGPERSFRVNLDSGRGSLNGTFPAGELLITTPIPVAVNATLDDDSRDLTPSPVITRAWQLQPGEPLEYQLTQGVPAATPVRLDLRAIRTEIRAASTITVEFLDETGNVRRTEQVNLDYHPTVFERTVGVNAVTTGAAQRRYLVTDPDWTRLRLQSTGPAVASIYVRPGDMPQLSRVPAYHPEYAVRPPPATWYQLDPVNPEEQVRQGRRILLALASDPGDNPDPDENDISWVRLDALAAGSGRELLVPRLNPAMSSGDPVAATWYRQLQNGVTEELDFRHSPNTSPEIIWVSRRDEPGTLRLQINGGRTQTYLLAGRNGQIVLRDITAGIHQFRAAFPRDVDAVINHAGLDTREVNRLRRFALRIDGHESLRIPFWKSEDRELIGMTLYQDADSGPVEVSARLVGAPAPRDSAGDFTIRERRFTVHTDLADGETWVLGSPERLSSGLAFFYTAGDDIPTGQYALEVSFKAGTTGYLRIQQRMKPPAADHRFYLDDGA